MNVPGAVKLKGVNHANQDDVNFELDGPQAVSNDCWWNDDETGTQRLDVYAYSEDGNWSTEPVGYVELQVIDPQLARTVIGVSDVVDVTNDINITIQTVPNGYFYELQMHQTDMENKYVEDRQRRGKRSHYFHRAGEQTGGERELLDRLLHRR